MKMKLSFSRSAVNSAFFFLLFLCMGTFATAQSVTVTPNSGTELTVLKDYSFMAKSAALTKLQAELSTLNANVPSGGAAEATHSVRIEFLLKAGKALKNGESVHTALVAGNNAANSAVSRFSSSININTSAILSEYAELFSI